MEVWKYIDNYNGLYSISNLGRFRRNAVSPTFDQGGYQVRREIIFKQHLNRNGYSQFNVTVKGVSKTFVAHRLVALAFIPNLNNYPEVNHIDGDKTNNEISNLEWCTSLQNKKHATENLLTAIGIRNGHNKLTEKQVLEILEVYENNPKLNKSKLALEYGVNNCTIQDIIRRRSWKYLDRPLYKQSAKNPS